MIDGELGSFIRARREAVRPEQVGLPPGTRRRTPGLRRSELATLAGISVEYLTSPVSSRAATRTRRPRSSRRSPMPCYSGPTTGSTCTSWWR